MSFKRRQSKRDANHAHIVAVLEQLKFSVKDTSMVGDDFPDLVVARNGKTYLVEIKRDERAKSVRELSKGQAGFAAWWKAPVFVARNADDCMKLSEVAK